jgi:NAD(P)-dependent dehydrogenase (short-subunit alcohol dehydrogenase family)
MTNTETRIVLVTGANKGIGRETVRQLAGKGHLVLLAARDRSKGEQATREMVKDGLNVEFVELDVTDPASVSRAVAEVEAKHGRLDSLINNAGIALEPFGTLTSAVPLATWERTFTTNVVGVVSVTLAFLPLLLRSKAARIVNVSSILGSQNLHADPNSPIFHFKAPAYDASKAALNSFSIHLAYELRNGPHRVNAAHPGWVKTELGGEGAPMEIEEGASTCVELATQGEDCPNGAFIHLGQSLPW